MIDKHETSGKAATGPNCLRRFVGLLVRGASSDKKGRRQRYSGEDATNGIFTKQFLYELAIISLVSAIIGFFMGAFL